MCDLVMLQDVEADVCSKCFGVWLEQAEVRKLVQYFSVPEYSTADDLIREWEVAESKGTAPKDFWREEKLVCPREGAQMQKHYFAGSRTGIDHCLVCGGFWLDGGELRAIATAVEPNPLLEKAAGSMLKEWNKGIELKQRAQQTLGTLILNTVGIATNPSTALWLIGSVVTRYILDRLRFDR